MLSSQQSCWYIKIALRVALISLRAVFKGAVSFGNTLHSVLLAYEHSTGIVVNFQLKK